MNVHIFRSITPASLGAQEAGLVGAMGCLAPYQGHQGIIHSGHGRPVEEIAADALTEIAQDPGGDLTGTAFKDNGLAGIVRMGLLGRAFTTWREADAEDSLVRADLEDFPAEIVEDLSVPAQMMENDAVRIIAGLKIQVRLTVRDPELGPVERNALTGRLGPN